MSQIPGIPAEADPAWPRPDDAPRPRLTRGFFKAHGLGNDYLVFETGDAWSAVAGAVARVCHRTRGVGGDGVVAVTGRGEGRVELRMFNPDGSEFERSGNGLRIAAAWLASRGELAAGEGTLARVGGDEVELLLRAGDDAGPWDVEVGMGRVRVGPGAAGADRGALPLSHPEAGELDAVPVSVGNPHCVVFGQPMDDDARFRTLGPFLERHPAFPGGANVQLARVLGPGRIRIRIWERGVGETAASGTSSCAAAAAAVARGALEPGPITVEMAGGELGVTLDADLEARLRGPVEGVCRGTLEAGLVESLATLPRRD